MKQRVLIVDDDPGFRELLRFEIEYHGFECMLAGTVEEGLMLLEAFEPEVIILDLAFEGNNGLDFLQCYTMKYEGDGLRPKLYVVSSETDRDLIGRVLQTGADEFIPKLDRSNQIMQRILSFST